MVANVSSLLQNANTHHIDELREFETEFDDEFGGAVADGSDELVVAALPHQIVVQAFSVMVPQRCWKNKQDYSYENPTIIHFC